MNRRGSGWLFAAVFLLLAAALPAPAQLLKKGDYGTGLTLAFYQFDDARSKQNPDTIQLKQTSSTPEEEIDYLTRSFGFEDLKVRHIRSIGLREGENFADATAINERQFTFNVTPRTITREEVRFDIVARFGDQKILEVKDVTVGNYETIALRGGRGEFGIREFMGPKGLESVPEKRALLVTVTATIAPTRGLQNRPTDLSRATDAFGSKVVLDPSDVFIMPSILNRVPPKFLAGNPPKGSITLEGIVTPEGKITNVRVLDSPDPAYNSRAIEAYRLYKFNPARLNGKPTYATYRETIVFGKPEPQ